MFSKSPAPARPWRARLSLTKCLSSRTSFRRSRAPWKFSVTGLGIVERLPAASLSFEGTVVMQCARCNEPVSVPVSRELVFRFTKTEAEANALPLDEEGDDEEVIVGSRSLSVADWVQEEAILSLPAMPLHDCEMDYENTSDEVVEAEKPNPFAALAAPKH